MVRKITAKSVRLKRAYESAAAGDGMRILVDRLWPRGVNKADAAIDHWVKDLAPSTRLRKWFAHDPTRWRNSCQRWLLIMDLECAKLDSLVTMLPELYFRA